MKENNKRILVLVVILSLLVVGLGGYIVYDKVLKDNSMSENNNSLTLDYAKEFAKAKDFEVVNTHKIESKDTGYQYYAIEYKNNSSNTILEIISINVTTNQAKQILLINNNHNEPIDYYINYKLNEMAFYYAYGQNPKIDNYIEHTVPVFPCGEIYDNQIILVFIKLLPNGFEITGTPGNEAAL